MGELLFISFEDLVTDFAKDHDLHEWMIIIASHEIMGSLKTKSAIAGISTGIQYESKYDNIEFVSSLRPTPSIMEHAYGNDKDSFIEMYNSHLLGSEPFMDLCCVIDMIVNSDCKVMIVVAGYEYVARIPYFLNEFIMDEFGVRGYLYDELLRLSNNYENKSMYEKIVKSVDFDVPDEFTGRNFDVIMQNYTDNVDEVKERLELQKVIAANMTADPGEENDIKSIFFNRFTEDLHDKVKELLMKRTDMEIKDLCRTRHIRIAPNATKEFLVNKILHDMKLDVARQVEYEETQ